MTTATTTAPSSAEQMPPLPPYFYGAEAGDGEKCWMERDLYEYARAYAAQEVAKARAEFIPIAAKLARREPLRALDFLDGATHAGRVQLERGISGVDEALRLIAIEMDNLIRASDA